MVSFLSRVNFIMISRCIDIVLYGARNSVSLWHMKFYPILAGPSGQHYRCYGVVDVSARSVFWCSQCTGEVDIWGPSGIVARRHLCDCAKTSTILKYRPCQNIDCAETLTVPNHWQHQNIDCAKTLTTPKHRPCQNIGQLITHAELDWSKAPASDYKSHILCSSHF